MNGFPDEALSSVGTTKAFENIKILSLFEMPLALN